MRTAPSADAHQASRGDGDHHGVARSHLGELLPLGEGRGEAHPQDQLAGPEGVALGPDQELVPGEAAGAPGAGGHLDASVDGGQEGEAVAGGAGRPQVAAQGAHGADLRRAHRAGRLGQAGPGRGGQAGPGDPGTDEAAVHLLQFGDPAQGHDHFGAQALVVGPDHEVGAPGEEGRPGMGLQGIEGLVEAAGAEDLHGPHKLPHRDAGKGRDSGTLRSPGPTCWSIWSVREGPIAVWGVLGSAPGRGDGVWTRRAAADGWRPEAPRFVGSLECRRTAAGRVS